MRPTEAQAGSQRGGGPLAGNRVRAGEVREADGVTTWWPRADTGAAAGVASQVI